MKSHTWLFWVAFAITITIMLFLFGCNVLVRKVPWNFIILIIFTTFESYLVASICIFQEPQNILIAAVLTFGMFLGLTILAFFVTHMIYYNDSITCLYLQTTYDVTLCTGLISSLTLTLIFMCIMIWIFPNKYIVAIVCACVVFIVSIFIVYDTQVITIINNQQWDLFIKITFYR